MPLCALCYTVRCSLLRFPYLALQMQLDIEASESELHGLDDKMDDALLCRQMDDGHLRGRRNPDRRRQLREL